MIFNIFFSRYITYVYNIQGKAMDYEVFLYKTIALTITTILLPEVC